MSNTDLLSRIRAGEKIPATALRFTTETPVFEQKPSDKAIKVKIHARSRDAVTSPYFGKVVHDFSTATLPNRIAIDDSHGREIGWARPSTDEYGITLSGVVIPNEKNPQHPSNDIAYNLTNSIPQQASISFIGDYDLGEIPSGMTAQINGKPVDGPALVVQNWTLRSCAICKEGVDDSTSTEVANFSSKEQFAPAPKSITVYPATTKQEIAAMSENKEVMSDTTTISAPVETAETKAEETVQTISTETETTKTDEAQAEVKAEELSAEKPLAVETPVKPVVDEAMTVEKPQPSANDYETRLAEAFAHIEKLTARVNALSKPSVAPIKGVPGDVAKANGPQTWLAALDEVGKTHGHLSLSQQVELADKTYPGLREQFRTKGKSIRQLVAGKGVRHGLNTKRSNSTS